MKNKKGFTLIEMLGTVVILGIIGTIAVTAVTKYLGSSMMLTRRLLDCVLPFPKGIVSHDAWIGAMAAFKHRMAIVDKPLLLYRRHDKNVTSKEIYTPLYKKLGYRLVILFNVLRRR